MFYTIDRIENGVAVLEKPDRSTLEVPAAELPEGCAGGDAVRKEKDGWIFADNKKARERIEAKFRALTGRKDGGET